MAILNNIMTPEPSHPQQIIQRDQDWAQAHLNLDLDLIDKILAEDYQQIQANGKLITKQDLLVSYASGERFWEIAESTDHHVQLIDELAIVIGRWRGKGINRGIPFDYQALFLSIYRRDHTGWKMVFERSILVE